MKIKYIIDKKQKDHKKKQLHESVVKAFGTTVTINGENIEVEDRDEKKFIDLLTHSGIKYHKAS